MQRQEGEAPDGSNSPCAATGVSFSREDPAACLEQPVNAERAVAASTADTHDQQQLQTVPMRTCRQLLHGQGPEALHQRGAAPVLRVSQTQLPAAVAPPGVHLGGGGDAQGVEAAADDLRDHLLVQHLDGAWLHPVRLCLVAVAALAVLVGAPGDDVLGRDGDGVLRAAGDGPGSMGNGGRREWRVARRSRWVVGAAAGGTLLDRACNSSPAPSTAQNHLWPAA